MSKNKTDYGRFCLGILLCLITPITPAQHKKNSSREFYGYLYAHTLKQGYGKLFYSVSKDGYNWTLLNNGKSVFDNYRGHPDICIGPKGQYYMIGVEKDSWNLIRWESENLVEWFESGIIPAKKFLNTPGYKVPEMWQGAPKMYYDQDTKNYIITWHVADADKDVNSVEHWLSMRTLYMLTKDFRHYTDPQPLFTFSTDIPTIDAIVKKEGDYYYVFFKDVRFPTNGYRGKSIRMTRASSLTGPYTTFSETLLPVQHEAPTIIPKKNKTGWLLYAEHYPALGHSVVEATTLNGIWKNVPKEQIYIHRDIRHGCMIPVNEKEYNNILLCFKTKF